MDNIETVKAYYAALDSADMKLAEQYLSDDYQLVGYAQQPLDKYEMFEWVSMLKKALPNLNHSLSNVRLEEKVVRLTVQLSGTNSGALDLRKLGIGILPHSGKFLIFPNGMYELLVSGGKIEVERDISPVSPNRRISGVLKTFGITSVQVY